MDPPENKQNAVTPRFLRALYESAITPFEIQTAILLIAAFFFAMRACEYCQSSGERKTKPVALKHLRFLRSDRSIIPITNLHEISDAEYVTVTFEFQKTMKRNERRTQQRTTDPLLCPVRCFAHRVHQIITTIPGWTLDTTLDTVLSNGKPVRLTQKFVHDFMKRICRRYGENYFGILAQNIGTRSIRSGAAMALLLSGHSTAHIMMIGRWSSDAFMEYIRPQVIEITNLSSQRMIHLDTFTDLNHLIDLDQSFRSSHPSRRPSTSTATHDNNISFNGPHSIDLERPWHLKH
jgi:hypothetical protein